MLYNKHKMHVSRRKLSVGLAVITAVLVAGAFISPLAHAASCGGVDTAIISCDASANPVLEIVKIVLRVMIGLVGVAAVGALIFAGIIYSSAGGEQAKVQKAKTMIQDTVIGIVLFGTMFIIGNFFIPNGIFGGDVTSGSVVSSGSGSSSGGSSGSSGSGTTDQSSTINETITIATWNVLMNNGASDIKAGAKKIAKSGADLIGFQELNFPSSRNAIKDGLIDCSGCDFSGYFPGSGSASGWNAPSTVSLVWNKHLFSKLDQGQIHVSDADGPANTGDKWITWVKLKDKKTGVVFYFADTHFVAHVMDRNGQVIQNYSHHIDKLVDFVKSKKEPIFIAGDFNIGYNYDKDHGYSYSPRRNLKKYDIYSNWEYFKKSSGSIDYIWATKSDNIKPTSTSRWSSGMGSDHKPVTMTVKIYGKTTSTKSGGTTSATPSFSSNITNFRDAGSSGYIKTGFLYRSGNLNNATASDKKALSSLLKGGTIIDLRYSSESGYIDDASLKIDNVTTTHLGITLTEKASEASYKATFVNNPAMRAQFAKALDTIANSSGPVLVHCKAGKDRTGWLIALAMFSVGTSKSQALSEYLKSPNVDEKWFNAAYTEATNSDHTGGSGKIIDFITRSISDGGMGVSQTTINKLKSKLN